MLCPFKYRLFATSCICTRHPCTCFYCSRLVLLEVRWLGRWAFASPSWCHALYQGSTDGYHRPECLYPSLPHQPSVTHLGLCQGDKQFSSTCTIQTSHYTKKTYMYWLLKSVLTSFTPLSFESLSLPFAMAANTVTNGMLADTALWAHTLPVCFSSPVNFAFWASHCLTFSFSFYEIIPHITPNG